MPIAHTVAIDGTNFSRYPRLGTFGTPIDVTYEHVAGP